MPALDDRCSADEPPTVLALVPNVSVVDAGASATLGQMWGHVAGLVTSAAIHGIWKPIVVTTALLLCIGNGYRFPGEELLFF
jgi:hypothetical protein